MSRKTDRLVKDIAELFVRYSLADWSPVIYELSKTGNHKGLAEAIEAKLNEISKLRRTPRIPKKRKRGSPAKTRPVPLEKLHPELDLFRDALMARRVLPTSHDLRMAAEAIG